MTQCRFDGDIATARRAALGRLLKPASIAIVGLSDNSPYQRTLTPTFESDTELFMVNPNHPSVHGRPTVGSLSALDRPIDAVMSYMSAQRTVELAEEAASLDIGGLVVVGGGFAETGEQGAQLQHRLSSSARRARLPVVGPNCNGYINVRRKISLTLAGRHPRRPGGITIVSQTGGMMLAAAMASWHYEGSGLNLLISTGNEAVTDLADFVDYLADDPETKAIGLIVETIRRPPEFFAAAARAIANGKPIVALKLARNERSRKMALSHTGALAGDAMAYDVAFRQSGIGLAYDPEELIDRLALFDQLPRERWSSVQSLGLITMAGGMASLSLDLAVAEKVNMPPLDGMSEWIQQNLPGITVANPLDTTGFGAPKWQEIVTKYTESEDLDALMVIHQIADDDTTAEPAVAAYAAAAEHTSKPCIISNFSGPPGAWVTQNLGTGLVRGRGLRPTLRGLASLGAHVRYSNLLPRSPLLSIEGGESSAPQPSQRVTDMIRFDTSVELLGKAGVPFAPHHVIEAGDEVEEIPFAGPYVLKLADVAHRTELGAVRLNVSVDEIPRAVADLRKLAGERDEAQRIAVQQMIPIEGECLIGVHSESELGPMVIFGLGGVFTEAIGRIGGRMAPFDLADARGLLDEFTDIKVMHGFRGRDAWDLESLAEILVAVGEFAWSARGWLRSLDINPLIYTGNTFMAVDALMYANA